MSFLDAKFTRKEDGSVKSTVYRKKMHTDQYLNFTSHTQTAEARSCQNAHEQVRDDNHRGGRREGMEHLTGALRVCGCPSWALRKVTDNTKEKKKTNSRTKNKDYRSQVVIPCVEGVSEKVHSVMKKYRVVTAVCPHTTPRCLLLHLKDKVELAE